MTQLTLVIGNKRYSSWSLRPWLALTEGGLKFSEVLVPLRQPETPDTIARYSPSGRVPVLLVDDQPIWESLAICEYAAELVPALWPDGRLARAQARAVAAEMHGGFVALRQHCPMDVARRLPTPDPLPHAVVRDLARIGEIWRTCRQEFGSDGPCLFGRFSIADAMYAPVVTRYVTYDLPRDPIADDYIRAIMGWPSLQTWMAAARLEPDLPAH